MELNVLKNFSVVSPEYAEFAQAKSSCQKCSLYSHYKTVVMSEGNAKNPTFLFVGEAPGTDEVAQNRPFIGKAGEHLRSELRKHSAFTKNTSLISNVLACRPLNNKFPDDSLITSTCTNTWLFNEISILKPKFIITLGNHALRHIRSESSVTKNRGKWKFLTQFKAWTFATFHPSYVLRCMNDPTKSGIPGLFASDLQTIATQYGTFLSDARLSWSDKDWNKHKAYIKASQMGVIK